MAKIELHPDFKDFLRLLNSHNVRYLLVGGYAVGYHGYPRATGDMNIWIEMSESNAKMVALAFHDFGMPDEAISESLFLEKNKVIRMGVPPVRLEVITSASGVAVNECYSNREVIEIDGISLGSANIRCASRSRIQLTKRWGVFGEVPGMLGGSSGDAQRAHVLPSVIEEEFSAAQSGASHYQARRNRYG